MLLPQPVRCTTSTRCLSTAADSIASHCPSRNDLSAPSICRRSDSASGLFMRNLSNHRNIEDSHTLFLSGLLTCRWRQKVALVSALFVRTTAGRALLRSLLQQEGLATLRT